MKAPDKISYSIKAVGSTLSGDLKLNWDALPEGGKAARIRIAAEFSDTKLSSAEAVMEFDASESKIFMNGYQTWTYCPEYTVKSHIRGLHGLPKKIIDSWSLDRYGDYHFVDYPNKRGVLHGESYCYFRNGKQFLLIASLDEQNGYTLFRYEARRKKLKINRDCEGLKVNGSFAAFELFVAEGTENEVFDAWFAAMGVQRIPAQPISGYSSWYNRYQDITEETINEDLEGCAKVMQRGELFQIDDGWEPFVGDWFTPDANKFPNGMKTAADAIHAKGYKAGLWLAPFVAQKDSALVKEHPDWLFIHDGQPWLNGSNWGGFYSLDIDNPEVISYVEEVFRRVFDEWGFDLVKLDFLYGAAPFGTETETRAGRMIRAMKLLRRVCGSHPILGCGVPVMPAFGLVEYCRVSCDVGLDWDDKPWMRLIHRERVSTRQAMSNTVFRRQLNGRAYLSDPDVFFLRTKNIHLSEEQKMKLAKLNAVLGGVFLTSDNMGKYKEKQLETYRQLLALRNAKLTSVETVDKRIIVRFKLGDRTDEVEFE